MRSFSLLCLLVLLVTACDETAAPRPPLSVAPSTLQLNVGDTARLVSSDSRASIRWRSSEPSIATVDLKGLVTGVTAGVTSIWAVRGADSATASVRVIPPICAGVATISPAIATLAIGDTARAEAHDGCSPTPNLSTWVSSDSGVAAVESRGVLGSNTVAVITALRSGQAAITARNPDDPTMTVTMAVVVR